MGPALDTVKLLAPQNSMVGSKSAVLVLGKDLTTTSDPLLPRDFTFLPPPYQT